MNKKNTKRTAKAESNLSRHPELISGFHNRTTLQDRNKKMAGVTIEVTLSTLLALTVLFLILNMFSSNLRAMVANGGIQNMFNRDNSFEKTSYSKINSDRTQVKESQVGVQIVGDQGSLAWWHQQAIDEIAKLANKPQPLSDSDRMNLALWLTIFAESGDKLYGNNALSNTYVSGTNTSYNNLKNDNHIKIQFGNLFTNDKGGYDTTVTLNDGTKITYNWDSGTVINNLGEELKTGQDNSKPATTQPGDSETERITNVQAIKATFGLIK
jgi:hypothetical protein